MKNILFTFVFILCSTFSFGQIDVYLSEYVIGSNIEYLHFKVENITDIPISVQYLKVVDTRRNSTIYYSDDVLIINNHGGFANAWSSIYDFDIQRNSATGSNLWNTTYMVEIQFAEMRSGMNPVKTYHYYTTGSIGVKLYSDDTSNNNSENNSVDNSDNYIYDGIIKIFSNTNNIDISIKNLRYKNNTCSNIMCCLVIKSPSGKEYVLDSRNLFEPDKLAEYCVSKNGYTYVNLQEKEKGEWHLLLVQEYAGDWSYSIFNNSTVINEIKNTINFKDNNFYDLSGRIIKTPIKGKVYILNGRKVTF